MTKYCGLKEDKKGCQKTPRQSSASTSNCENTCGLTLNEKSLTLRECLFMRQIEVTFDLKASCVRASKEM